MKLLIVDDQPGVTEGLCHGVNWAQLGFSQVQAVNSVREARAAMLNTVTDVMLCDIEMPEETGLELFKWVKKQGFATRCIFLTAHAKFSYAQEAMHLGAFDYIIQPAPYSEISQVTARAVKDVQASRDQKELTQMGRAFNEQAQAITAQAIRAFLSRQHNERDVKTLQGLGIFPRSDRNGYLVLIHILRWEPTADHWEKQLLAVALNNIAAETFAVHSELSPIASVDEHSYAMLLQNTAGEEMDLEGIMRQLMYISNVAQQYLRCSMAFYLDDKLPVPKMPDLWEKLLHMQGENVILRSGVFRLKEAVSQDRWNCMRYDGKLIAVPGNNPSAVAIGFEARTDVLDELGIDAASIQTMEDMHALLLAAKQQNPSSVPLVPHFGQTLMMLDCDPLNNGLGVLLHNTGTEVVNLYDTPEYEELCNQMHQWYTEGLILRDAPLTNAPNTRLMQMYGGVAFSHRVAEQNVVSVTRSTKQRLTSITLGSKLQNTSVLNIGWCISSRSEHKREGMQLLQYLYTDREAADLLLYGVEGVDYRRLDADHVTNIDELPANEWSTVHWGQPNCQAASTWVNADGTEVGYTGPTDVITSEAYGFTYTPKIELRPTVNSCLEIVRKYNNALLSGYLDPEEALPLFRSELHAAGIDKVIADKQYQLERWKAKNS